MNFGQAIEALKEGKKVTRHGWDGKNMFLWLKPATTLKYDFLRDPILKQVVEDNGGTMDALGTICMKTADNKVLTGWLASQTDMLSEDWEVVDSGEEAKEEKKEDEGDNFYKSAQKWCKENKERRGVIIIKAKKVDKNDDGHDLKTSCGVVGPNDILVSGITAVLDDKECPLSSLLEKSLYQGIIENIIK